MADMYSIAKVCEALAGVRAVIFSDMTNVAGYGPGFLPPAPNTAPSYTDTDLLYSIAYERYTGEVTRQSVSDQGGDSARYQLSIFVPRSRSEVDLLLQRWRNRLLNIVALDRYGSQHILYDAIASWTHTTGGRPGSRHGYTITFSAPSHYILPAMAGSGDILSAPPVGGNPPGSGDNGCCITIAPLAIAYIPTPTGNALNLSQIVTTQNGSVYFIDYTGRAILLNAPPPRYYAIQIDPGAGGVPYIVIPDDFPLPDPDDYAGPTYDPQVEISRRFFVKLASRWIAYDHSEGYYIDYATRRVYFNTSTEEAYLEIYSYENIPPLPL